MTTVILPVRRSFERERERVRKMIRQTDPFVLAYNREAMRNGFPLMGETKSCASCDSVIPANTDQTRCESCLRIAYTAPTKRGRRWKFDFTRVPSHDELVDREWESGISDKARQYAAMKERFKTRGR
jgi:hypothetical protein